MGALRAPAAPQDVADSMPTIVETPASALPVATGGNAIAPVRRSQSRELLLMLPVLAAVALAALIASMPLSRETSFILFCCEVVLSVLAIFVSVTWRPRTIK